MRKWLWIAPMIIAASWAQGQKPAPVVVPMNPTGRFVVPSGTELRLRIDDTLSTNRSRSGDKFSATLLDALVANGATVLPAGTHMCGHVAWNKQAGIWRGRAQLVLTLDAFVYNGHTYPVELTTATYEPMRKHKRLTFADPNAHAAFGSRQTVTVYAETVVRFTLGAPVPVG
jgi:hypothetical protein